MTIKRKVKKTSTKASTKKITIKARAKTKRIPTEYKTDEGWFYTHNNQTYGPLRTRDLARLDKKRVNLLQDKEATVSVLDIVAAKPEPRYAYKMVRVDDNVFGSSSVPKTSRLYKTYKPNEITRVDKELFEAGFGLCVFPDEASARQWKTPYYGSQELWKVEVGEYNRPASNRPSIGNLSYILPVDGDMPSSKILEIINKNLVRNHWPNGCMITDWVRLIEKVS